ncbi:hypothetical protein [Caballeronia sp. LjRoot31]|uniref:hypothetical protein n=1 Tax=Caballeronia sp. LjRoot31 TaxID=3342324 RepID=UPI003ED0F25D
MQSKSAAVAAVGAAKSSAFIFFVAMLVGMLIFKLVRHCESKREMQRARQADTPDNVEIKKRPGFCGRAKESDRKRELWVRTSSVHELRSVAADRSRWSVKLLGQVQARFGARKL